jgi:hypothetical protein
VQVSNEQSNEETDTEIGTVETLRLLADLIEQSNGTVNVTVSPKFLREVAEELENALCNDINIMNRDGSQLLATITDPLASIVVQSAVSNFLIEAITADAIRHSQEIVDNAPPFE